jgi:DNA-binding winged helix-turn-helix (wHTH) protein
MTSFYFGNYAFEPARYLLRRGEVSVDLTRKAFALLQMLVEGSPGVVSKQEILDRLWPACFVTEGVIVNLVGEIRAALGDEGRAWLRTVHGVGYAFRATVTREAAPPPTVTANESQRFVLIEKAPLARSIGLLEGANVLGRGLECQIRIASRAVSRRHAQVELAGGGAVLTDLGSRNGTYLRERRITEAVTLADGDSIRLGTAELILRIESPPDSKTETAG